MNNNDFHTFKKQIAASFGVKVSRYENNAVIQQRLLERLVPTIRKHCTHGSIWVDAGCGNGALEQALYNEHFPATLFAFDIALQSLHFCKSRQSGTTGWLCADIDALPFKPTTVDGLVAASVLQWSGHLEGALKMIAAILKPYGHFIFAIFTDESFREVAETRRRFDLPVSINLPPPHTIDELLNRNGMICHTTDCFTETLYFPSAIALLRHLSIIGSTSVASKRMSRTSLSQFCDDLENCFGTPQGVPLTYTALFGSARKEVTNV